ncbi:hypothetical protein KC316_g93 [Hortaea werneckii]|nr:hypothetical protein KC316_g93 [Hortaea werneckii]
MPLNSAIPASPMHSYMKDSLVVTMAPSARSLARAMGTSCGLQLDTASNVVCAPTWKRLTFRVLDMSRLVSHVVALSRIQVCQGSQMLNCGQPREARKDMAWRTRVLGGLYIPPCWSCHILSRDLAGLSTACIGLLEIDSYHNTTLQSGITSALRYLPQLEGHVGSAGISRPRHGREDIGASPTAVSLLSSFLLRYNARR